MQEQQKDRLGHKSVDKEAVILLWFVEAHLVHVIPAAEPFLLRPAHDSAEGLPQLPVEPDQSVEAPLEGHGGEDGLIERIVNEPLLIQAEEFLGQRRPAARWCHNEYWFSDRLALESREEDVVELPARRPR